MIVRLLSLVFAICASELSIANDVVVLTRDGSSKTDGYWNTQQGYFVGCFYRAGQGEGDREDPGFFMFRLGFVRSASPRVHPATVWHPATISGPKNQKIGRMWLVIRDNDQTRLRVPLHATIDDGNYVHMYTEFNATPEFLPGMEIEFEEIVDSTTQRTRVPVRDFLIER